MNCSSRLRHAFRIAVPARHSDGATMPITTTAPSTYTSDCKPYGFITLCKNHRMAATMNPR